MSRHLGLTPDDLAEAVQTTVQRSAEDGMAMIGRDPATGAVVAAFVCNDLVHDVAEPMAPVPVFAPIAAVLQALEEGGGLGGVTRCGEVYHQGMVAVSGAFAGGGRSAPLWHLSETHARLAGYHTVVAEVTGEVSQHMARKQVSPP